MDKFTFACSNCGNSFDVTYDYLGYDVNCPWCDFHMSLPAPPQQQQPPIVVVGCFGQVAE